MAFRSEHATPLAHGIWLIDTGYQRPMFDAAYLIVEQGRAAFVDTGTSLSVPRLLDALKAAGVARDAVDWVIPTHVHLDHAGGAGALMAELPAAQLLVHPRGAKHLINPSVLLGSARAVYGDEAVRHAYGTVLPVEARRVVSSADGMMVALAGRPLTLLDTPGHARHHHCIWDERSQGFFTGDTFGLSYREFDTPHGEWLLPTTTPTQFDPLALRASIERMLAQQPQRMYLTHYGCIDHVAARGQALLDQLDAVVALGERVRSQALATEARHAALADGLTALYLEQLQRLHSPVPRDRALALLAMDIELNAQGMAGWLDTVLPSKA